MQLVRVTCLFTGHYNTDLHVAYIDVIWIQDIFLHVTFYSINFSDFTSSVVYFDQLLGAARHTLNMLSQYLFQNFMLEPIKSLLIRVFVPLELSFKSSLTH